MQPATAILVVKTGILWGLRVLVPSMLAVGMSGMRLGGRSRHPRVVAKRRRMPVIAGNGLLILVPAAFVLQHLAASGAVGPLFYAVQAVELTAGAVFHDGLGDLTRLRAAFARYPRDIVLYKLAAEWRTGLAIFCDSVLDNYARLSHDPRPRDKFARRVGASVHFHQRWRRTLRSHQYAEPMCGRRAFGL